MLGQRMRDFTLCSDPKNQQIWSEKLNQTAEEPWQPAAMLEEQGLKHGFNSTLIF